MNFKFFSGLFVFFLTFCNDHTPFKNQERNKSIYQGRNKSIYPLFISQSFRKSILTHLYPCLIQNFQNNNRYSAMLCDWFPLSVTQ